MQHFSHADHANRLLRRLAIVKKNASARAGIGILFPEGQAFFKRKSRHT